MLIELFLDRNPVWYDTKTKLWWVWSWNETRWYIGSEVDILRIFMNRHQITRWLHPQIQKKVDIALRVMSSKRPADLPKDMIQFKDIICNLNDEFSFIADPKYFSTNPLPHRLGTSEEVPTIDNLFEEWVGKEKKEMLYEILAYCMLSDYPIHKIFALLGVGRNGKSTFMRLVEKFIGKENITSSSVDLLETNRFETSKLKNKLVCQLPELDVGQFKKTALLKRLVGQDLISFEFKNKNPDEGYNYAKMFMIGNTLPSSLDLSEGWYSRWIIIDFPNQFEERGDPLKKVPESEWENLGLKCMRVLKGLLEKMVFTGEGDTAYKRKVFEEKSNILKVFMDAYYDVTHDVDDTVWKYDFQDKFEDFCRKKSVISMNNQMVNRMLEKEFNLEIKQKFLYHDGKEKMWVAIFGIREKKPSEPSLPSDISYSPPIYSKRVENEAGLTGFTWEKEPSEPSPCYKCKSKEKLTQVPDSISGKPLNICEICLKEGMI